MSTPTQAAKAGHTPTPWVVKKVKTSIGHCFKVGSREMVEHPHGGICLYDDDTTLNPHERGQQEANANRIVECVNSHDGLVAERDRLREALEGLLDCIHDTSDEDEAREKARAALKEEK